MPSLTANQIRTYGVSAIAAALAGVSRAMVSVRGKDRFVVMEIERWRSLRECELTAALAESHVDIAAGRFEQEPVAAHMNRLDKLS